MRCWILMWPSFDGRKRHRYWSDGGWQPERLGARGFDSEEAASAYGRKPGFPKGAGIRPVLAEAGTAEPLSRTGRK